MKWTFSFSREKLAMLEEVGATLHANGHGISCKLVPSKDDTGLQVQIEIPRFLEDWSMENLPNAATRA